MRSVTVSQDCPHAAYPTLTFILGLGLAHEHKRPDRDDYVTLHCANVADMQRSDGKPADVADCTSGPKNCKGYGCQFSTAEPTDYSWAGPYDMNSLMHYSPYLFSKDPRNLIVLQGKYPLPNPDPKWYPTLTDARRVCDIYYESCRGVCGDGIVSPNNWEECDDGNNIDGDGCSANCKKEGPGTPPVVPGGTTGGTCSIQTCDPTPGKNMCHQSSSCIKLDGATGPNAGKHLCACAHGFRGAGVQPGDASQQIRIPGTLWPYQTNRVFVNPGVACTE